MLYFVLEIIGTIAFAVSGAMLAVQKKMDMPGVFILRVLAAKFRWKLPRAE